MKVTIAYMHVICSDEVRELFKLREMLAKSFISQLQVHGLWSNLKDDSEAGNCDDGNQLKDIVVREFP